MTYVITNFRFGYLHIYELIKTVISQISQMSIRSISNRFHTVHCVVTCVVYIYISLYSSSPILIIIVTNNLRAKYRFLYVKQDYYQFGEFFFCQKRNAILKGRILIEQEQGISIRANCQCQKNKLFPPPVLSFQTYQQKYIYFFFLIYNNVVFFL